MKAFCPMCGLRQKSSQCEQIGVRIIVREGIYSSDLYKCESCKNLFTAGTGEIIKRLSCIEKVKKE